MRELYCNDCGSKLGEPFQSNIENHTALTGHKDIIDRELILDDGTPSTQLKSEVGSGISPAGQTVAPETEALMKSEQDEKKAIADAKEVAKNAKDSDTKKEAKDFLKKNK